MSEPDQSNMLAGALAEHEAGRFESAERMYREILEKRPDDAEALHLLGVIHHQRGDHAGAVELIGRAIESHPEVARYHNNIGEALRALGRVTEAIEHYRRSVALAAGFPEAHYNLGLALSEVDDHLGAAESFVRAADLKPDYSKALLGAGIALAKLRRYEQAAQAFFAAIKISPQFPDAYHNLGHMLQEIGQFGDAIRCLETASARDPGSASHHTALANCLARQGKIEQALREARLGVRLDPRSSELHSTMLFLLNLDPTCSPADLLAEHVTWADLYAKPLEYHRVPHKNDRSRTRRLRVGYVSPHFQSHPVAFFIEPILAGHDREHFEIFCYSDTRQPDEVTARLQALAGQWRDSRHFTHAQLVEQIRADEIDILVELANHTNGHRLLALAPKPAPIQMSYLAYPATTGVAPIDYKLTDPILDPPGQTEAFSVEKLLYLDHYFCYRPDPASPEVAPPPCVVNDFVTFGVTQTLMKFSDAAIESWCRLLDAVPRSRLILQTIGLHDPDTRAFTISRFGKHGIGEDRLELQGYQPFLEFLKLFERIDISLDTFPYSSGTTTCHSLYMGVPVVGMAGDAKRYGAVSRMAKSVMDSVGLRELIAEDADDFVMRGSSLANDVPRMTEWRRTMRDRLRASALLDAGGFTRNLESVYREAFARWREAPT